LADFVVYEDTVCFYISHISANLEGLNERPEQDADGVSLP